MAITFAKAQSVATATGTNPTATLGSAPTEGNLLMTFCMERSGGDPADFDISGAGWTKRFTQEIDISDLTYRQSMAVWTKVAVSSEPSGVQITGASGDVAVMFVEYEAGENVTWTFESSADNNGGKITDVTTISTGTTGSVSAGDLLVICVAGIKENYISSVQAWGFDVAGIDDCYDDNGSDIYGRILATAFRQASASGTYTDDTSQISGTLSNRSQMAGILIFSAATAGSTSHLLTIMQNINQFNGGIML